MELKAIRRRITEILKERQLITVAELAAELGIAQVSVRHHLDILIGEDLVQAAGLRRHEGAGRPSQVYSLTPQAARLFPQRHDVIAEGLLAEVKGLLSPDEVRGMFVRMANKTVAEAPAAQPGQALEQRLEDVTHFLTDKGYSARWEKCDGHYEIHAYNCPYLGISDRHHELCLMDQEIFHDLVPGTVRLETRALHGAPHCTYVLELKSQAS